MKFKNYVFRQTLNFSLLGHLRKKDGGECFAPLAFALLRAEMLENGAQDRRRSQKFKKILNFEELKQVFHFSCLPFIVNFEIRCQSFEACYHAVKAQMYEPGVAI